MKIGEKLKNLFRRQAPTKEELAARAKAEAASAKLSIEQGNLDVATQANRLTPPGV